MKKFYKISAVLIVFVALISFAFVANAQAGYCDASGKSHSDPNKMWPIIQCGSAGQPCCDFKEAVILFNRLVSWFIAMATTIATITFVLAGAKMIMNPENPGERQAAIDMFKKTVYGLIIILIAWLLVHTIVSALVSSKSTALYFLNSK